MFSFAIVVVWIAAMVIGSPMLFVQTLEVLLRNIFFFHSIPLPFNSTSQPACYIS